MTMVRHRVSNNAKRMKPQELGAHLLGLTVKKGGRKSRHSYKGLAERYSKEAEGAFHRAEKEILP